jgi:hypothetical protein
MGCFHYQKQQKTNRKEDQQEKGNQEPNTGSPTDPLLYNPDIKLGSLETNKKTRGKINLKEKKQAKKTLPVCSNIAVTLVSTSMESEALGI